MASERRDLQGNRDCTTVGDIEHRSYSCTGYLKNGLVVADLHILMTPISGSSLSPVPLQEHDLPIRGRSYRGDKVDNDARYRFHRDATSSKHSRQRSLDLIMIMMTADRLRGEVYRNRATL